MVRLIVSSCCAFVFTGCAMRAAMPELAPMAFEGAAQASAAPPPLVENHFARDRSNVSEEALREILAAPVFLEEHARIGVVPVVTGYAPDERAPTEALPGALADALDESGMIDLASEVSTEWPIERGLPGLRELAARYRTEYLLLVRSRFNDVVHANPWAVGYVTLLGALVLPGTSVDTAGVLEATLFDVKTGTILFTVNERIRGDTSAVPLRVDAHIEELHRQLVTTAQKGLTEQVLTRMRRLVASRTPSAEAPVSVTGAR